jgi:hypothetical protein
MRHPLFVAISTLTVAALGTACATAPRVAAAGVIETTEAVVDDCRFLGTVFGRPLFEDGAIWTAAHNARIDAQRQAADLGATHIVFNAVDGWCTASPGFATARAYRCD